MSTKPFKDIEQMMKDAAEGYEHPFEEAAWRKMEVLLDKDKDRRRPILWLWWLLPVFIGAGIGSYFIFKKPDQSGQPSIRFATKTGKISSGPSTQNEVSPTGIGTGNTSPGAISGGNAASLTPNDESLSNSIPLNDQTRGPGKYQPGSVIQNAPTTNASVRSLKSYRTHDRMMVKAGDNAPVTDAASQPVIARDNIVPATSVIEKKDPVITSASTGNNKMPEEKTTLPVTDSLDQVNNTPNKESARQSRWYFIVAAGAEGGSPRLFSVDKISARGGVTIGYKLDKNFSVQSGLYAGSKKYIAGPKDYNPKAGSYWSTVEIVEVEANCLVLEIPLDVRYDLHPTKNTNIFTTAGLSSYIMSKEDYEYVYNRYGYQHYAKAGYKGNKHLLAVLRLSAGVETKISKTFSLNAAPALSIPLAGVGEGQVKLYSTEIMVGLKYQPLKKIKHK
jgi:hypothetical protein